MKKVNPPNDSFRRIPIFFILIFSLSACGVFPKGVKALKNEDYEKAEKLFKRSQNHKVYGPGAKYYLGRLQINKKPTALDWIEISKSFCDLEQEVNRLPRIAQLKLRHYDAGRGDIMKSRDNLQTRIFNLMSRTGLISELLALEASQDCWSAGAVDSLQNIIVNKTINPEQQVYRNAADKEWKSRTLVMPDRDSIYKETGRSCNALLGPGSWNIHYDDANIIKQQYDGTILQDNYAAFWEVQDNIWTIFQMYKSYCDMDQFKIDYPRNRMANDCWFDAAQEVLCQNKLKPLLAFHRENPHTALDMVICYQIVCLTGIEEEFASLNQQELDQVRDIELMIKLRNQLLSCKLEIHPVQFIEGLALLAKEYKYHWFLFDLATTTLDYFATRSEFEYARKGLDLLQPLYPDSMVCNPGFYFQEAKQFWFDNFDALLTEAEAAPLLPIPVDAWNTSSNDEYSLISWGETDEVFFVRRRHETGEARVMTSRLQKKKWTKPETVAKLSISDDVTLLSLSSNGRQIMLQSNGKLWRSLRPAIGRPWGSPEEVATSGRFAGNAWVSPNDSLLLLEYYVSNKGAIEAPKKNIAVAKLGKNGRYGKTKDLGGKVNTEEDDEGNPTMALDGRMLFFTSDNNFGLGDKDMYTINLSKPGDWSTMGVAKNLGIPINTIYDDEGLTYFSEYTGLAYFHRADQCKDQDRNIYQVRLGPGVFPEKAMRLAGLVLDENRKPISGGFMEFTPDYQLHVHSQGISKKGTYSYTVEDSTAVVRLFPEIPGYYSEHDATHFLDNVAKGTIIRDTFILTSFDYIRRNFKLVYSTFYNGIAEFDQPDKAYPELTRLAKIATRMGAELELSGHTDGAGYGVNNLQLSIDRAQSVKDFLVEKCGFDANRIRVYGFGATQPICPNDTEEGRRCNRRVQVVFKMPELPKAVSINSDSNSNNE